MLIAVAAVVGIYFSAKSNCDSKKANDETRKKLMVAESLTRASVENMSLQTDEIRQSVAAAVSSNSLAAENNVHTREMATAAQANNTLTSILATEARRPWVELTLSDPERDDQFDLRYEMREPPVNAVGETIMELRMQPTWCVRQIGGSPASSCIIVGHFDSSRDCGYRSQWFRAVLDSIDFRPRFPVGSTPVYGRAGEAVTSHVKGAVDTCAYHIVAIVWPTVGKEMYYYEQVYLVTDLKRPVLHELRRWKFWHGHIVRGHVELELDAPGD
jgi:hypothetical protein